jgi:hypothetical protein
VRTIPAPISVFSSMQTTMVKDERRKVGGHINILARKFHSIDGHVKARWGGLWDKIAINGVEVVTSQVLQRHHRPTRSRIQQRRSHLPFP